MKMFFLIIMGAYLGGNIYIYIRMMIEDVKRTFHNAYARYPNTDNYRQSNVQSWLYMDGFHTIYGACADTL